MTDDTIHRRELRRLADDVITRTELYKEALRKIAQLQIEVEQLSSVQAQRLYDFNALLARCQRAEAERDLALEILEHAADEHLLRLWEEAKVKLEAAGLSPSEAPLRGRGPEGAVPGTEEEA